MIGVENPGIKNSRPPAVHQDWMAGRNYHTDTVEERGTRRLCRFCIEKPRIDAIMRADERLKA